MKDHPSRKSRTMVCSVAYSGKAFYSIHGTVLLNAGSVLSWLKMSVMGMVEGYYYYQNRLSRPLSHREALTELPRDGRRG